MPKWILILIAAAALVLGSASMAFARTSKAAVHTHVRHAQVKTHRHGARLARAASVPVGTPVTAGTPGPGGAAVSCDLYASPAGSDASGNGTLASPFATLRKLDQALTPGQTGCLEAGTYGSLTTWSEIATDGTSSAQITISAAPGQTATVIGWVDLEASYTTVENLRIDGSNTLYAAHPSGVNCRNNVSNALTIDGHNDILQYVNYFQSVSALRSVGIGVGYWGHPDNTIIRYNQIHDVGGCDFYDHMIYLDGGNNVEVYDNWMWNDAHGWGIKLDPGPTNASIWGNVIDHAGSGFMLANSSGTNPTAGNQIFNNIVMNSVGVNNPDIHWGHPGTMVTSPGLASYSTGNKVYGNDSYNNPGGISSLYQTTSAQISLTANTTAVPQFADAAAHNYTLLGGSLTQMRKMIRS